MSEINFVHITDMHISSAEDSCVHGSDTVKGFRRVAEVMRKGKMNPNFVVLSGDLCHESDEAGYRKLKALLDEELSAFDCPVFPALGNHDSRAPFRRVFLQEAGPSEEQPYYYSAVVKGLRILVLDSKVPGEVHGQIDAQQLTWLEKQLVEPAPEGTLLVVHHPMTPLPAPMPEDHMLHEQGELLRVAGDRDVVGILTGHIHMHVAGMLGSIPWVSAGSTSLAVDPAWQREQRIADMPGFNVGYIRENRMVVSSRVAPGAQADILLKAAKRLPQEA